MKSIFRSLYPSSRASRNISTTTPGTTTRSADNASVAMSSRLRDPNEPLTVIELFQSQGCNSCPPSNANLLDLTNNTPDQGSNTLLLTYHVTYWDHLGWPDTFADRDFDKRQRNYVRHMGLKNAFTPQVIVNGRSSGVGTSKSDLARVLKEGDAGYGVLPATVSVTHREGGADVEVSASDSDLKHRIDFDVLVVWYDPASVDVRIARGENGGKTLPHRNVVKKVERYGTVTSGEMRVFAIECSAEGLDGVMLVQEGVGGKIVSAARV